MRLLNVTAFFFAITSALLLYGLNYDTRRLEDEVQAKEHAAELARNDIAVLKAERGNLAQARQNRRTRPPTRPRAAEARTVPNGTRSF